MWHKYLYLATFLRFIHASVYLSRRITIDYACQLHQILLPMMSKRDSNEYGNEEAFAADRVPLKCQTRSLPGTSMYVLLVQVIYYTPVLFKVPWLFFVEQNISKFL